MMTVKQRFALRTGLRLIAAVAITLFFLFPIYWLFMISFKTAAEIFSYIKGFQQFETSYTAAVAFLVIILLSVVVMLALKRVELSR